MKTTYTGNDSKPTDVVTLIDDWRVSCQVHFDIDTNRGRETKCVKNLRRFTSWRQQILSPTYDCQEKSFRAIVVYFSEKIYRHTFCSAPHAIGFVRSHVSRDGRTATAFDILQLNRYTHAQLMDLTTSPSPLKINFLIRTGANNITRLIADFHPPLSRIFRIGSCFITWTVFSLLQSQAAAQGSAANFDQLTAKASDAREQGDASKAIALYKAAIQLDPKWPDGWWYVGSMQYGMNAFGPASEALTHYIDLTPEAGPAYALRGLCEFEESKNTEALEDLQRGISLGAANQPKNAAIILYHEALLLTKIGRFEEALGQFTTMVKHGTFNEDIVTGIGLASLRLPILPKEIQPAQTNEISMVGHAASNVMNGNLALAHSAFIEIFQEYPSTANLHYLYGYLLFTADPDQAIAQFRDELIVSPSSAITHAMLAWAYGLRGDYPQALPDAQNAVTEDPSLPLAQLVLGRSMIETGEAAGGVPHLQMVLAAEPQNLEAHLALAKAYSKLGKVDDARRERLVCLELSGQGTPNASM